jgi:putative transposase
MKRKKHSAEFKSKVAFEALKGHKTINELGSEYEINPAQISQWKKQLSEALPTIFKNSSKGNQEQDKLVESLYKQIGQLTVELEWLKKKLI